MPQHPNESDHPFRQSRPYFIDLLATDRARALDEFAELAAPWLRAFPPRELRQIDSSNQDEVRQIILFSFLKQNGRKLTLYKDNGSEFRLWFGVVSKNECLDWIEKEKRRKEDPFGPDTETTIDPVPPPEPPLSQAVKDLLKDCLERLEVQAQLALLLEGEVGKMVDRTQFASLLGMAPSEDVNSDASNYLGGCRKKMIKLMIAEARRRGIDETELGAP